MKKNVFDVFKEMNANDEANGTATLGMCPTLVRADKTKAGGHVTMGIPGEELINIMNGTKFPVLLLLDKAEYQRLMEE